MASRFVDEEKVWSENDTVNVALWKQLLFYKCSAAAEGLLADVFYWAVLGEQRQKDSAESGARDALEGVQARAIEDAMVMLCDTDGDKFRAWAKLYVSDPDMWKLHIHDWVQACHTENRFKLLA